MVRLGARDVVHEANAAEPKKLTWTKINGQLQKTLNEHFLAGRFSQPLDEQFIVQIRKEASLTGKRLALCTKRERAMRRLARAKKRG